MYKSIIADAATNTKFIQPASFLFFPATNGEIKAEAASIAIAVNKFP
jgi:hypothetical protein